MPPPGKPVDFPMTPYPDTPQQQPQVPAELDQGANISQNTLPPLEPEFLQELDFTNGGMMGMNGMVMGGDAINWEALMSDGDFFNNIGGGWSDGFIDEQSLR